MGVDVVVLGGGPAGSTAATLLARAGLEVLVLERERFPRFHIGESLLPYNVPLFRRLGVWEELIDGRFQRKWGATFAFEPDGATMRLDFPRGYGGQPMAVQVRRAELDRILLDNARRAGATVREEVTVERVVFAGERATGVVARDAAGGTLRVAARAVIDATGRDSVLGKQLRLVERDPTLRQAALFGHWQGVELGLGRDGGDILVAGGPFGWFWMIPLDGDTASVGAVVPGSVLRQRGDDDLDTFFDRLVAQSANVSRRLAGARRLRPVTATADFSYRCRRFAGDGWLLAGDAAAFLDPVFSSGVYLAMRSAERAAHLVARRLDRGGRLDATDGAAYERFVRRGLDRFRRYILAFYDPACSSIFRTPPPRFLERATVSAFAGRVFERDPRIWAFEKVFFGVSAARRRAAARGEIELPPAPAHDGDAIVSTG